MSTRRCFLRYVCVHGCVDGMLQAVPVRRNGSIVWVCGEIVVTVICHVLSDRV